jgi:hypothetical protein
VFMCANVAFGTEWRKTARPCYQIVINFEIALWHDLAHTGTMTEQQVDRQLIGDVVRREINRRYGNISRFVRARDVPKRNLDRVLAGEEGVMAAYLEHLEGALGMPRDGLLAIGMHEWDGAVEIGMDQDLIRWARRQSGD